MLLYLVTVWHLASPASLGIVVRHVGASVRQEQDTPAIRAPCKRSGSITDITSAFTSTITTATELYALLRSTNISTIDLLE